MNIIDGQFKLVNVHVKNKKFAFALKNEARELVVDVCGDDEHGMG